MVHLSALSLALNRPGAVSLEQVVASLFAAGEQGAWYDPSAANVTWRRNLLTYTEQFDNAAWTKGISTNTPTLTASGVADPLGGNAAQTWLFPQTGGNSQIYQAMPATMGGPLTASIWIKAAAPTQIRFGFYDGAFDQSIVDVGTTWQRISKTRNAGFTSSDRRACYLYTESGINVSLDIFGAQLERGTTATAYQRIVTPEITYLADVQSQPLLFTDSTGAAPVTGVEQPVGLILDKRKGLVLGSELVADSSFDNAGAWTAQSSWVVSGGKATYTTGLLEYVQSNSSVSIVSGKWYKITYTLSGIASGTAILGISDNVPSVGYLGGYVSHTTNGTYNAYFLATSNTTGIRLYGNASSTAPSFSVDNVSVKLLDGNHAYQTGSTARPVLRARYNLLTYSEQFNDASWQKLAAGTGVAPVVTANAGTAPDSTTTADRIVLDRGAGTTLSDVSRVFQSATAPASGTSVFSVWMRSYDGSSSYTVRLVCGNGTSNVTVTPTWTRFSVVSTDTSTNAQIRLQGDQTQQTADILAWGAHINYGTSAGDYQRIAAATDYATTSTITGQPFRPYLEFPSSGNDDFLQTASIDFTATDEMTVGVAVNKTGDAVRGCVLELSALVSNAGTFNVMAPEQAGQAQYAFFANGSQLSGYYCTTYAAPTTNVLSCTYDIGQATLADEIVPRINKATPTKAAYSNPNIGTGNFGNYPLYIGRRGGTTAHLFGNIYGIIIRGKVSTAGEILAMEDYLAGKAGLTL